MNESSSHKTNGTPDLIRVKEKRAATAGGDKRLVEMTFKGRTLQGLEDAAKAKGLTVPQYIRESLENTMIKEGFLPDWWHNRSNI